MENEDSLTSPEQDEDKRIKICLPRHCPRLGSEVHKSSCIRTNVFFFVPPGYFDSFSYPWKKVDFGKCEAFPDNCFKIPASKFLMLTG
jgi:hypothetical protein